MCVLQTDNNINANWPWRHAITSRHTHTETWLWDLRCFVLVLFKRRLSHTDTHDETTRQVSRDDELVFARWCKKTVMYPLCAAERTAVSAYPFVHLLQQTLVSMQHFAFPTFCKWAGLRRQFAADKGTVCGCDAAQSLNMSSRISFTLNGSSLSWRGVRPSSTRVFFRKNSKKPYLSMSLCSFSPWLRLVREPVQKRYKLLNNSWIFPFFKDLPTSARMMDQQNPQDNHADTRQGKIPDGSGSESGPSCCKATACYHLSHHE